MTLGSGNVNFHLAFEVTGEDVVGRLVSWKPVHFGHLVLYPPERDDDAPCVAERVGPS